MQNPTDILNKIKSVDTSQDLYAKIQHKIYLEKHLVLNRKQSLALAASVLVLVSFSMISLMHTTHPKKMPEQSMMMNNPLNDFYHEH